MKQYDDMKQRLRLHKHAYDKIVSFGDVIEALPTDQKDVVLYQRRVKRAGLKRACYIMPRDMAEKPGFAELMKDQRSRWICGSRFQRGFPCVLAQDLQPGRKS